MNIQNQHTLPEGWEMKRLEEVAIINPTRGDKCEDNEEVTFLGMTDVSDEGKMVSPQVKTYGEVKSGFTRFSDNDVLVAKITPCFENGKGALVSNLRNGVGFGSTEFHVIRGNSLVDEKFIFYHTITHEFRQRGKQQMSGSAGQQRVPSEFLRSYRLSLPPLSEQRQITAVLGTWDRAIEQTKELLKALRTRHRGLMQQLLTGKKRLPGFEGSFKHLEIGEVAQEVSVRNRHDKVLTVLSCTKYDGLVDSLSYFGRKIFSDTLTTYKIVSRGEFAYATNHIEEGSIGYQSTYDSALISPMYTVFKTDSTVYDPFLYFLLKTDRYIQEYKKNMVGSIDRRGGLRWNDFSKIIIQLPYIEEQRAIVRVLDTSLKEIRQNEDKLEALREQKRGLMQCLLTGLVRVPLPAELV